MHILRTNTHTYIYTGSKTCWQDQPAISAYCDSRLDKDTQRMIEFRDDSRLKQVAYRDTRSAMWQTVAERWNWQLWLTFNYTDHCLNCLRQLPTLSRSGIEARRPAAERSAFQEAFNLTIILATSAIILMNTVAVVMYSKDLVVTKDIVTSHTLVLTLFQP